MPALQPSSLAGQYTAGTLPPAGRYPLNMAWVYVDGVGHPYYSNGLEWLPFEGQGAPGVSSTVSASLTTTDATQTTIATIPLAASSSLLIEGNVVARRTGGASGAAGDSGGIGVAVVAKRISDTVTLLSTVDRFAMVDQDGWGLAFSASGTDVLARVTGAAANTINWRFFANLYEIA